MKTALKKIIALLTVLVIVSTLLPMGAFAEDGADPSVVIENEAGGEPAAEDPEEGSEDPAEDLPAEETPAEESQEDLSGTEEEEPEDISVPASVTGSNTYKIEEDGDRTILKYFGEGDDPEYGSGGAPWYSYHDTITDVIVEEGVTTIGQYFFYDLPNLVNVELPTTLENINDSAFQDCTSLLSIVIPEGVVKIGTWAFKGCSQLGTADLPSTLESIGGESFFGCSLVQVVYRGSQEQWSYINDSMTWIPNDVVLFTGGTTGDLTWIFRQDGTLAIGGEGEMPDYDEDAPWYIFRDDITALEIGEGVTSIGAWAFAELSKITSVTIPGTVQSIGDVAFYDCGSLTTLTVCEGVETIGSYAFGLAPLKTVSLPGTLTEIADYVFEGSGTTFYYAGSQQQWNENVTVDPDSGIENGRLIFLHAVQGTAGDLEWFLSSDGELLFRGEGEIPDYPIGNAPWAAYGGQIVKATLEEGVSGIGTYAFKGCSQMKQVFLPATLETIEGGAFNGTTSLEEVHTPSLEAWLQIEYSGYGTAGRPLYNGAQLYVGGAVLTHAVIPQSVTVIHSYAFACCDTLEEVTLPDIDIDIERAAFVSCVNLAEVHFPGTEAEAESLKQQIPEYDNDYLLYAQWLCWDDVTVITPRNDYLILAPGESHDLKLEIPAEYLARIHWSLTDEDGEPVPGSRVISVDENGTVTALEKGTAGVHAEMYVGSDVLTAHFRIDVTEAEPAAEIESIRTTGSKATVKLYSLSYAEIPILPVLAQNNTSSGSALIPQEETGAEATGVAVTAARFINEKTAALFDLVVKDDRTLQIVPKYEALELAQASPKKIADTYKSKIEITVGEGGGAKTYILKKGTGDATYTLSVKKTKPTVTATAGKINSLVAGHEAKIKLKGSVTAIELNPNKTSSADIAVDTEARTVRLAEGSTLTKGTRYVYLLATVKGWAVKVPVTLKVTVAATKPTIKLGKTTLTVTSNSLDSKSTTVKITPAEYMDYSRYVVRGMGITENGADVGATVHLSLITYDGGVSVSATNVNGAHTLKVKLGLFDRSDMDTPLKTATLTVKTRDISKVTMTLKAAGAIDLTLPKSCVKVTPTVTNVSNIMFYEILGIENEQGEDMSSHFRYGPYPVPFEFRANEDDLPAPGTYKVKVKVHIGPPTGDTPESTLTKTVKITVKQSDPAEVPVSVAVKVTGTLDVLKTDSAVTVRPVLKNCYDYLFHSYDLVITKTYDAATGKTVDVDVTDQFRVDLDPAIGVYTIRTYDTGVNHKDKFKVRIVAEIGGVTVKSKAVALNVKQGKLKMTQSVKTGVLYKDDGFDYVTVRLGCSPAYKGIDSGRIRLDAKSAKYFDLTYRYDGTVEIGFKDNVPCAPGTKTAKIKVYMYGNETNTPNKTVTVKITVK